MSDSVRVATFNVALSDPISGRICQQMRRHHHHARFSRLAAILQKTRPDIVMLCEFDHLGNGGDDGGVLAFCRRYLEKSQHQLEPIHYPYCYCPSTNTGLLSPVDLNGDGKRTLPQDGLGFGDHHGHYGFVILSRYPIQMESIRTWQNFLWKDMPDSQFPYDYYSSSARNILPLSSKNHIYMTLNIHDKPLSLLCCHPTPPVFDGAERRNKKRNHDEIRLLTDLIDDQAYLYDDQGQYGGPALEHPFIVMGDLNADTVDGDGNKASIERLLLHSRLADSVTLGENCPSQRVGRQQKPNYPRQGNPDYWTHLSGLRLDYVLPSSDCDVFDSGVFWPDKDERDHALLCDEQGRETAQAGSDHRLVWVDIKWPPST